MTSLRARIAACLSSLLFVLIPANAQHNASTANGCNDGFYPGTDSVIYTTPYTYAQVMSVIGSFKNITWSGSPYDTVTLNGTDNTVGTARTYDIAGAHVVETITLYSKPPNGPYDEVHTLAQITLPAYNLTTYGDYDGTTVTETCGGLASTFNFTINFCANNATLGAAVLHAIHSSDAMNVTKILGGKNFTSCADLQASSTATASSSMTSATPATYTGAGVRVAGKTMASWLSVSVGVLGSWLAVQP